VLLANSRPHWWSNVHCIALERIGDRIAVHDCGLGFGTAVWTTYRPAISPHPSDMPNPPSASDNLASVSDNLGSTIDEEFTWDNAAPESLAVPLEDPGTDLVVGAINGRKSRRVAESLNALRALTVERRLQTASQTYASLDVRQVADKASTDTHWILTGLNPRARFYVAARKSDSAAIAASLALLAG
jgi:hypothetical protein